MGSFRLALIAGGIGGAAVVGACGLQSGGVAVDEDSGPDVVVMDGGGDVLMLPDAPMDISTPDLGTGETESGVTCTCTPAVPMGWSVVTYTQKTRPGCGSDFNMPTNLVESVSAAQTQCACTCNANPATQPTCGGNLAFALKFGPSNNQCGGITGSITCGATCTAISQTFNETGNGLDYMSATANAPNPANGMCGNVSVMTTKGQVSSDQGRTCQPTIPPGTCGPGLCVPTPAVPDAICIQMLGVQTCPMGFPNTHFAGTSIADNRACAANQGCVFTNMGTCAKPTLSVWKASNTTCNGSADFGPAVADGTCQNPSLGNAVTFESCRYTSSISGAACGYGGTCTPTGGVAPAGVRTICCL
jgi:hypothetical protein